MPRLPKTGVSGNTLCMGLWSFSRCEQGETRDCEIRTQHEIKKTERINTYLDLANPLIRKYPQGIQIQCPWTTELYRLYGYLGVTHACWKYLALRLQFRHQIHLLGQTRCLYWPLDQSWLICLLFNLAANTKGKGWMSWELRTQHSLMPMLWAILRYVPVLVPLGTRNPAIR